MEQQYVLVGYAAPRTVALCESCPVVTALTVLSSAAPTGRRPAGNWPSAWGARPCKAGRHDVGYRLAPIGREMGPDGAKALAVDSPRTDTGKRRLRVNVCAWNIDQAVRYVSDRIAQFFFLAVGLVAIGLAIEGLLRGELRVVGRREIVHVGPQEPWWYWGVAAFYLVGGVVFILVALRSFKDDREL
jgi:hypothetical protein